MSHYRWRPGSRMVGSAQVAGEVCESLAQRGELTAKTLLDESRPEDAPLHGMFEWDDAEAAEQWRESQAGAIIRAVEVVVVGASEPVRAFVSVANAEEGPARSYVGVSVALQDADSRAVLLSEAKAEMRAFSEKYRKLTELAQVIDAMCNALESVA